MGADPVQEDADYLVRFFRNHRITEIEKRKLFERTKGRFKKVAAMEPAITRLKEYGILTEQVPPPTGKRGHPKGPEYLIHLT
jgi:hypothetical protein